VVSFFIFIFKLDSSDRGSSQSTIDDRFVAQRAEKRPKRPNKYFDKKVFKRLLLNFIIKNNISFRTICSKSFKDCWNIGHVVTCTG
jgi:hypothetical protein